MDTPKHLMAIAASKNTAAFGKVISATAKKEERLCGVFAAHRERRYNPKAAMPPERTQVIIPGRIPAEAKACDKVSVFVQVGRLGRYSRYARGGRSTFLYQSGMSHATQ